MKYSKPVAHLRFTIVLLSRVIWLVIPFQLFQIHPLLIPFLFVVLIIAAPFIILIASLSIVAWHSFLSDYIDGLWKACNPIDPRKKKEQ